MRTDAQNHPGPMSNLIRALSQFSDSVAARLAFVVGSEDCSVTFLESSGRRFKVGRAHPRVGVPARMLAGCVPGSVVALALARIHLPGRRIGTGLAYRAVQASTASDDTLDPAHGH